jgi:hypothetical protein
MQVVFSLSKLLLGKRKTIIVNKTNALVSWVDKALNQTNIKNTHYKHV